MPSGPLDGASGVALAHDYLLVMRGAERVFHEMSCCWPEAPIVTLLYDEDGTGGRFADRDIRASWLDRLGTRQWSYRKLLPLMPAAARSLHVSEPLLISSSSAFAHGLRSEGDHVCYCHTPFRYAWFERESAEREVPRALRPALRLMLRAIKTWDLACSKRVTAYIANSRLTQERIATYWAREAPVVHPPVEIERFSVGEPQDFVLVVGELVGHKRIEQALEACYRAGAKTVVVGGGPESERLKARFANRGVDFRDRVSDEELAALYRSCLALVIAGVEEFGMVAVEAQASGRPVVAIGAGGVRETVIDGDTGVLVADDEQLAEAIRYTSWTSFSPDACVASARRFEPAVFRRRLIEEVERVVGVTSGARRT